MKCPHCGVVDFSTAPRAQEVFTFVEKRGRATAGDVATALGISVSNAVNQLRRLTQLGLLVRGKPSSLPAGGVVHEFTPTPRQPGADQR